MERTPFITQNRALAIALHVAGAHIQLVRNYYSPEDLAKWGLKTVAEALKAGRQGKVCYAISQHPRLQQFIAIYDEHTAAGDAEVEVDISEEDAIRIACHTLKVRKSIEALTHDPKCAWLAVQSGEYTEERNEDGTGVGRFPSVKLLRSDAPEATRKHLGL